MTDASAAASRLVRAPIVALAFIFWGTWASIGCQDPVDAGEVVQPGRDIDDIDDVDDADDERDTANDDRPGTPRRTPRRTEGEAANPDEDRDTSDATDTPPETVPAELASGQAESAEGDGDAPDDGRPAEEDAENAAQGEDAAQADAAAGAEGPAEQPTEAAPGEGPVIHNGVIDRFEISRFALARDIIDREPVGITDTFERGSGPLHVFIEARNRTGENVELRVGFSPAESERRGAGVRLNVPSTFRYRTRARANTRRRPGEWICVVTDERGRVLVEQRFRITETAE